MLELGAGVDVFLFQFRLIKFLLVLGLLLGLLLPMLHLHPLEEIADEDIDHSCVLCLNQGPVFIEQPSLAHLGVPLPLVRGAVEGALAGLYLDSFCSDYLSRGPPLIV